MSAKPTKSETPEDPEDIIDLTGEEDDEFDEDGEEEEMFNPLEDLLVNDEGENIANAVTNALDRIAKHMENQNKILIKIFGLMNKAAN